MQFTLSTVVLALLTSVIALPAPAPTTPERSLIDLDPNVDLDLLNNLCLGIAVCNPVTVTEKKQ